MQRDGSDLLRCLVTIACATYWRDEARCGAIPVIWKTTKNAVEGTDQAWIGFSYWSRSTLS